MKNEKVHKIAEGNTAEIFEIGDKYVCGIIRVLNKSTNLNFL